MRGTAVVVGGGLGGLTAAVALRRVGWEVVVLERAPEFGEVGAGIGVMPNAMRALDALDLGEAVRANGTPRLPGGVRDHRGRALGRLTAEDLERGGRLVAVHRADLHRVLRSALPADSLVTSADVVEVEPAVRYLADGGPVVLEPDLVVAADGIASRVRSRLWPDAPEPVYAGTTAWRAVVDHSGPLEISQSLGPGTEFGVLPLAAGRVYWYAATLSPAGLRADDELAEVRRLVDGWHDPIPALLAATDPESVLRHDVHELASPLSTYVRGRVALLGDSAHAMTPFLGQGACQAIEDGVVLAAACSDSATVEEALVRYDRERRPRTQAVARASRLVGRTGHGLRNPVAVAVRDALLRSVPAKVAVSGMTRFSAWRPPVLVARPSPPEAPPV